MPALSFEVEADYDKVVQLAREIKILEQSLINLDKRASPKSVAALEGQLATLRGQFAEATKAAAAAGAEMEAAANVSAPQFFKNEDDYNRANELRTAIADLQAQMQETDPQSMQFSAMRSDLEDMQGELKGLESTAADAAAELGASLGGKAAEVSAHFYDLNNRVNEQAEVVERVRTQYENAAEALRHMTEGTEGIEEQRAKVKELSDNLTNAENTLRNLTAEQKDTKQQFKDTSNEIDNQTGLFAKLLGGQENYKNVMAALPAPIGQTITSIQGMTRAAMSFIATPLGAVIAAIALALKAVSTWFESSAEGQMAFIEGSSYLSGILAKLKDVVIKVGELLYKAFNDPQKAAARLWEVIKENIVNRINAVGGVFTSLGKVIKETLSGNFGAAGDACKELTNQTIQLATGIENAVDKSVEFAKSVHKAGKDMQTLAVEEEQLRRDRSKWQKTEAELDRKIAEARKKMYSGTTEERLKATADAEKLINEKYKQRIAFAEKEAQIIADRNEIASSTQEDIDAANAAAAKVEQEKAAKESAVAMFARRGASMTNTLGRANNRTNDKEIAARQKIENELYSLQAANEKARIDLMAEGKEKRVALINAEYDAQIKTINDKQKQIAALNKEAGVKGTNENGLTNAQQAAIDAAIDNAAAKQQAAMQEMADAELQAANEYLRQWGSIEEQRAAISADYDRKIAEARAKGDEWGAKGLERERDNTFSNMDLKEMRTSDEFSAAFSDLGNTATITLQAALDKMAAMKDRMAETLSPTELREYMQTMQSLSDEITNRNPFDALKKAIKDYQAAQAEYIAANKEKAEADAELSRLGAVDDVDKDAEYTAKLAAAKERVAAANSRQVKAANNLKKAHNQEQKAIKQVTSMIATAYEGLNTIGDAIGGIVGETVSSIGAIGDLVGTSIDGVVAMSETGAEAMSAAEKATVILAIIQAAIKVFTVFKEMFEGQTNEYEEMQAAYAPLIEQWDALIERKKQYINIDYGADAVEAGKEVVSLYERQEKTARALAKARLQDGKSGTTHSIGYRMNESGRYFSSEDWAEMNAAQNKANKQGMSLNIKAVKKDVAALTAMSGEQLAFIRDNATTWWAHLDSTYREQLENIIEYDQEAKDTIEQTAAVTIDVSWDEFHDAWVDMLTNMDTDASDFADKFSDYMNNALIKQTIAEKYSDRLKEVYKKFQTDATDADGKFDRNKFMSNAENLKQAYQDISDEALAEIKVMRDALGIQQQDAEQAASQGAFDTMTEDTAGELNGRFTALQISGEQILAESRQQTESVLNLDKRMFEILTQNAMLTQTSTNIASILSQSYLELQGIRENTAEIITPIKTMSSTLTELKKHITDNL